ncbi:MAG: O-antigen ligase family protein, partial [Casimicrobiaceae bacterium]
MGSRAVLPNEAGRRFNRLLFLLIVLAVALPLTWPWQRPPLAQFLNQAAALGLWALALLVLAARGSFEPAGLGCRGRSSAALWFAALVSAVGLSVLLHRPPTTVWLAPLATLVLATALAAAVSALDPTARAALLRALSLGVILAALANGAVACLELSRSGAEVRAAGLLAQPNHLATLVLWAGVAAFHLGSVWSRIRLVLTVFVVLLFALLLATQSRTGLIAACWLSAAGLCLSGRSSGRRWAAIVLALTPFGAVFALAALGVGWPESFSQRLTLWANAGALVADAPWLGHGFGAFNRAWSFHPFAERAPDVFDHAHNPPLHWAVEL